MITNIKVALLVPQSRAFVLIFPCHNLISNDEQQLGAPVTCQPAASTDSVL
jgi:hypothetical protein